MDRNTRICKQTTEHKLEAELQSSVEFIAEKLSESRNKMKNMDIVIPYNNGGGQSGIRINPMFQEYTSMLNSMIAGMNKLEQINEQKPATNGKTKLSEMRVLFNEKGA